MTLQASSDVRKGEVALERKPDLFVQTCASRKKCFLCGHCGVPCGTPSQQLSLARGQSRRNAVKSPAYTIPELAKASYLFSPCHLCPAKGCDEVFCGESCRDAALKDGPHVALCSGRSDVTNARALRQHAMEHGEELLLAVSLLATAARASDCTQRPELQLLKSLVEAGGRNNEGTADENVDKDVIAENNMLLSLVLVHDLGWIGKHVAEASENSSSETRDALLHRALTPEGYFALVSELKRVAMRLDTTSPLVGYCQELMHAPLHSVASALSAMSPFVNVALEGDALQSQALSEVSANPILLARIAARLAQAGEAAQWGGANPFDDLRGSLMALFPAVEHSCLPNASLEVALNGNSVSIQLRALRNIAKSEVLTLAQVPVDSTLAERDSQLKARFGESFICDCSKCRREHWGDSATAGLSLDQIRELAEQATLHALHDDAYVLYSEILEHDPNDGDALHSRGMARYESGRWAEGNVLLKEGYARCPSHKMLKSDGQKILAYDDAVSLELAPRLPLPKWESYLDNQCFVTVGGSPVVTAEECAMCISQAEALAEAQGGWSTVRHYAVPTTDLNIHEVPALLDWFLKLMRERLRALLAAQFGSDLMGERGSKICVGDAFLVKYSTEGGSKHIPVHKDYSTHSLTIALNPPSEYEGGGTYFCKLGKSLRPELGHVVSFSGDLQHGGDPITHGTRYIVAVFLYVDSLEDRASIERAAKRLKTASVDHSRLKELQKARSQDASNADGKSLVAEPPVTSSDSPGENDGASWLLTLGSE